MFGTLHGFPFLKGLWLTGFYMTRAFMVEIELKLLFLLRLKKRYGKAVASVENRIRKITGLGNNDTSRYSRYGIKLLTMQRRFYVNFGGLQDFGRLNWNASTYTVTYYSTKQKRHQEENNSRLELSPLTLSLPLMHASVPHLSILLPESKLLISGSEY